MLENKKIQEIINHIHKKELSIKEVVQHYLNRIKKINPSLNAIILQKDEEKIISEAEEKDKLKDKSKPLFGLPIAIKDLSDVIGIETTYGFPGYKNNFPKQNSFFVDLLIKNGAIIIGKTNSAELGVGGHTINRLFGPTSNVYDLNKSAAGSSGGASTAVAAGLLPFADGTDQMGSCRGPAAYSNTYGFRPTPGLIASSRVGHNSKLPLLTTPGCFSKNPEDMSIMLDVIVGKNSSDPYSFNLDRRFKESLIKDKDLSNIKIGWLSNMNNKYNIEHEILDMCEDSLNKLNNENIVIEKLKPDFNTDDLWNSWTALRSKSIYNDTINMGIKDIESMTHQAIWEYKKGSVINLENIELALSQKNSCLHQINKIFANFDLLALPSAQIFPFDKRIQYPTKINNIELDTYHRWLEVFILPSLLELPTITVPVGFNKNNLPMGMQIIGKRGDDLKVIAFAKKYEEIFNYSNITPKY